MHHFPSFIADRRALKTATTCCGISFQPPHSKVSIQHLYGSLFFPLSPPVSLSTFPFSFRLVLPDFRCLSRFSFKPVSTQGAQEDSVTGCAAQRLEAAAETIRAARRRLPRCLSPALYFQTRLGSELLVRRKQRCPT